MGKVEILVRAGVTVPVTDISRDQISNLVDTFYDRIWADQRLGPIFKRRLDHDKPAHLARMKKFWASVLLHSGEYHGRPVPKHKALHEVNQYDYALWLRLFNQSAQDVLPVTLAEDVIAKAERIAQSLWLASFGDVGHRPPEWLSDAKYMQITDVDNRGEPK